MKRKEKNYLKKRKSKEGKGKGKEIIEGFEIEMDAGSLEMDLGMEFYEQWNWQRFREAESMELEVEDEVDGEGGVIQIEERVEHREKVRGKEIREGGQVVGPRRMGLPQYDGAADDFDEGDQATSISKIGVNDAGAKERQMDLPQYNGTAEEVVPISKTRTEDVEDVEAAVSTSQTRNEGVEEFEEPIPISKPRIEEAVPISNTGIEDVSVNARQDDSIVYTPSLDEALDNNAIETQEQKVVAEDAKTDKTDKTDSGGTSERRNCEKEAQGDREMTLADGGTIADFLGSENGDEEIPKAGEDAIPQKNLSNILELNTTTTEVTTESGLNADVDAFKGDRLSEEQINDKIDDSVSGAEKPVSQDNRVENSSPEKAATEIGVESVIGKGEDGENNASGEANGNVSDMEAAHREMTIETAVNGNVGLYSEIEGRDAESTTSGFLSNKDLKDLEGKPSSISTMDQSPVKFITHDQDFSTTDHILANDDSVEEDIRLPPLLKMEAPIQTRRLEIPDSDAITESSQQSPQKLNRIERTLDSAGGNTKNEEPSLTNDAAGEDEDRETEDFVSSFGRECATSSIDPKRNINEPETIEAESLQNETDNPKKADESVEVASIGSEVKEDSKADKENDTEAESLSAQSLSQKKTNKRGRPPGRKRSGIVNTLGDEESAEKKAKLVKPDSDEPMSMEVKDNINASSPIQEKKGRGRPPGRKLSTLSVDNLSTEQEKVAAGTPESHQVTSVDTIVESVKHSRSKEMPGIGPSPNKSAPEKRKRGRPAARKISTLSTVTDDGGDMEGFEREVIPMDEEDTRSNLGTKSIDEPVASSPIHSTQEKRGRGRPSIRKASGLTPQKKDADEAGGNLNESNDTTIAAPRDNINGSDEPIINDTMDELTANSSSPIKRKRGRPANRKSSGLSSQKEDTEEVTKDDSSNVLVVLDEIGTNEVTPNHKSNDDHVIISPSSVKRKRGRPAGRKPSGIEPERNEVEILPSKTSDLSHDEVETQEITMNRKWNDDSDDSSPVRPRKRGRSSRKTSALIPERISVNEATDETSQGIAMEESPSIIANNPIVDVHSADQTAEIGSSPVKRGRGRPISRKVSRLGPEKTAVTKALAETPDAADINGPVDDTQSFDEPPTLSSPPERSKRGRPGSRKVSGLDLQMEEANQLSEPNLEDIVMQEVVAANTSEPLVVNSSPEKRKRGRPSNRTSSGVGPANKDSIESVEATSKIAAITAFEKVMDADINEPEPDTGLSATSSPEKRKRGRPARKVSSLITETATNGRMSSDIGNADKKLSTEIVDSDDELQDESPPAKKAKPEPNKRGRPSTTKAPDVSTEDTKANDGNLTDKASTRAKSREKIEAVIQTHDELPTPEKKRRGRPSATKARRISNSDSDVTEEQPTSKKVKPPGVEVEELVESEGGEEEAPAMEKKKRGRPTLLKSKGKQNTKTSEPVDENIDIKNTTSIVGSSKGKISGSQVSTSSNTSSSSQRQDAFLAEMKAMKLVSIPLFRRHFRPFSFHQN